MKANRDARWRVGILAVALLWCGLLLGVSFVATPAKFMAPSLSLAVALDVGRQTFAVMNKVEWLFVAVLLALILTGSRSWLGAIAAGVVALLVLAETFWLLPQLDRRVALVMEGQQLPASGMHSLYVLFELTKLVALAVLAAGMARRLRIHDERSV